MQEQQALQAAGRQGDGLYVDDSADLAAELDNILWKHAGPLDLLDLCGCGGGWGGRGDGGGTHEHLGSCPAS